MKRTKLRRIGARKKRELGELHRFRIEVLKRAGYQCERCGRTDNLQAHHRYAKGRCGPNIPENGSCLCTGPQGCHDLITAHLVPDWRDWIDFS